MTSLLVLELKHCQSTTKMRTFQLFIYVIIVIPWEPVSETKVTMQRGYSGLQGRQRKGCVLKTASMMGNSNLILLEKCRRCNTQTIIIQFQVQGTGLFVFPTPICHCLLGHEVCWRRRVSTWYFWTHNPGKVSSRRGLKHRHTDTTGRGSGHSELIKGQKHRVDSDSQHIISSTTFQKHSNLEIFIP